MHLKILSLIGVSTAAVAGAVALTVPAAAQPQPFAPVHVSTAAGHAFTKPAKTCYSNLGPDSQNGYFSTRTSNPATYTSAGAADVVLQKACKFTQVQANGILIPGNPVSGVMVIVRADVNGLPGSIVVKRNATGNFATGDLNLTLAKPIKLPAGTSWVSVQPRGEYSTNGWYWESSTTVENGTDAWQNSGGQFGQCSTWGTLSSCFGDDYDFMLQLS